MNHEVQTIEEMKAKITLDKIGFICCIAPRRIGVISFMTFLEYRHFKPGTPANELFQMALINWETMGFALVVIPWIHLEQAKWILKQLGLRVADGVPTLIHAGGVKRFPIDLPNVFTVENIAGHFLYKNSPDLLKTAEDFEDEACQREIESSSTKEATSGV